MAVVDVGATRDGPMKVAATPEPTLDPEIDEYVFMKVSVRLGPFKTQIFECQI